MIRKVRLCSGDVISPVLDQAGLQIGPTWE
jgi:hypothetical protein